MATPARRLNPFEIRAWVLPDVPNALHAAGKSLNPFEIRAWVLLTPHKFHFKINSLEGVLRKFCVG